ncbi:hypothetical protein R1CP_19130 [Rhodococcus opacus]|uniref:LGFP repeat-containing protein n=2 Tax=Rhodococcus opacus TaxID=37919 RepID=A0A1B1K7C1_RHOOP|nr:hypothetical protein R1CP_19130 [Rhodococcus opacus]
MRSDRQELPEGFTKEEADKAEVQEAQTLAASRSRNARSSATTALAAAAPTDCMNYWPRPDLWVCGAIRVKYDSLGGAGSFLLWPTSNELVNPDGFGRRQTFQNGPIYWSAASGAHPVVNHFFAAWQRNGWESGPLGYPTTDEIVNPDGLGRRQEFQNTAAIYWKLNEAYAVRGAIRDKWNTLGAEQGSLGYPSTDEINTYGEWTQFGTRMNEFEGGGLFFDPVSGFTRHGRWIPTDPFALPEDEDLGSLDSPGDTGAVTQSAPSAPGPTAMTTSTCPEGTNGYTGDKAKYNCIKRVRDAGGTWWNLRQGAPGGFGIEHYREDHHVEDAWVEGIVGRYFPERLSPTGSRWGWAHRYTVTDPNSTWDVFGLAVIMNAADVAASAGVDQQQFGLVTAYCYIPKKDENDKPVKIQHCPDPMPPGGPFYR